MLDSVLQNLVSATAFALLGVVLFLASFWVVDKLTPGSLWGMICDSRNLPLAVLMGCMTLGLALIVAAAIH